MEALSGAASIIAVTSLAIQLVDSIDKLCHFWTSIKEAPDDVLFIITDLRLLSSIFTEISFEAQHSEPNDTLEAVLKTCTIRVKALSDILSDIEPGFSSARFSVRKWTAVKTVLKQKTINKFQESLRSLKITLILVQQNQQR